MCEWNTSSAFLLCVRGALPQFTQELVDDSLITEVLVDRVFTGGRHRPQGSDTELHLSQFTAPSSCTMHIVALSKMRLWREETLPDAPVQQQQQAGVSLTGHVVIQHEWSDGSQCGQRLQLELLLLDGGPVT